jgi:hypothetical protein
MNLHSEERNLNRVTFRSSMYDVLLEPSLSGKQFSVGLGITNLTEAVWK